MAQLVCRCDAEIQNVRKSPATAGAMPRNPIEDNACPANAFARLPIEVELKKRDRRQNLF
jgi:hypothetical protein